MKNLEEKAIAYALNMSEKFDGFFNVRSLLDAYFAGAIEALESQWRSVEDELPLVDDNVLVVYSDSFTNISVQSVAYWDGEDWYTIDGTHIRPTHWMSIPKLSNPESKKISETKKQDPRECQ